MKAKGLGFLAAVLAFAAFAGALSAGFVLWDDDVLLTGNPRYRGLGLEQLRWMATTDLAGHYHPLTWLSFALDYELGGLRPFGYHLTNLLLHSANAALFFAVARRVLASDGAGFAAALFFALHPLRVESVTWVTERRDVLSGFFVLLSALFYLRRSLAISIVCFALALLSKAIVVPFPLALLLLDARRLGVRPARAQARALLVEKIPYFALSAIFAAGAIAASRSSGVLAPTESYGIGERAGWASYAFAFYLGKIAVPLGLSPIYEIERGFPTERALIGVAVLVAGTAAAVALARRAPGFLLAWLGYALLTFPTLGFLQSGPQFAADRYTYFAGMPWALAFGWGAARVAATLAGRLLVGGLLALLAAATVRQVAVWRDSRSLWEHAVSVRPRSAIARYNLGRIDQDEGRLAEAAEEYRRSLEILPDAANPAARFNLGTVFALQGDFARAIEEMDRALRAKPAYPKALCGRGRAQLALGAFDAAERSFRDALAIDPRAAEALTGLGQALWWKRDASGALDAWSRALTAEPTHLEALNLLGMGLLAAGRAAEAEIRIRAALDVSPGDPTTVVNLAAVLERLGRRDEAAAEIRRALAARPDDPLLRKAAARLGLR